MARPSGSGKTTLLNLVGGLDASDSGSIVVDGNAFDQMSQSQLVNLSRNSFSVVLFPGHHRHRHLLISVRDIKKGGRDRFFTDVLVFRNHMP